MNTYTLHYSDPVSGQTTSTTLPIPEIPPQPNELYQSTQSFVSNNGLQYSVGDVFILRRRTDENPFGYYCSLGNWVVRCKYHESIWSSIDSLIHDNVLKRVE